MFAATSCGPGALLPVSVREHRWFSSYFWTLLILFLIPLVGVNAEKNKNYHIQSLCKNHFSQLMYKKIDGALVWSQNERNIDCLVTFQTHSILQRFMLRFDMLQLDCNDHLFIYDNARAGSSGFKLVITAIKDPKHVCQSFLCACELCIHPDLVCDEVNHCADNSDESFCQNNKSTTLLGLELTWFVLISVSCFLAIGAGLVGFIICICRHNPNSPENQIQSIDMNGSTKFMHKLHSHKATSLSGNLHHPANKFGYTQQILAMVTELQRIWHLTIY